MKYQFRFRKAANGSLRYGRITADSFIFLLHFYLFVCAYGILFHLAWATRCIVFKNTVIFRRYSAVFVNELSLVAFSRLPEQQGQIMPRKDKQSHYGGVIEQEQSDRLVQVKEDKGR